MKAFIFSALTLSTLLTVVEPILADEVWGQPELTESTELPHLHPRINALLGYGNLTGEGRQTRARAGGGATIELGQDWRTLETGALLIPTAGEARALSLALPMWAKFRVVRSDRVALFVKAGAMSAFEVQSAEAARTRNIDVLMSGGLGGRVRLGEWADLVLDATYNRGLLDHSRERRGTDHQGGVLVFTGLSFPI